MPGAAWAAAEPGAEAPAPAVERSSAASASSASASSVVGVVGLVGVVVGAASCGRAVRCRHLVVRGSCGRSAVALRRGRRFDRRCWRRARRGGRRVAVVGDGAELGLQRLEIERVVGVLAAVLHEVDDRVERLEEVVAHLGGVGQVAVAHLHHDVFEPVRDVADVDEPDHARRALERVGIAQHLIDERLVVGLCLERDDALVQALQEVGCLFLELGDERAAVEVDHVFALALSRVLAMPGPRRRTPSLPAPTPSPSPRAARRLQLPASIPRLSAARPSLPHASP